LDLRRPITKPTARYGTLPQWIRFTWERKRTGADALRKAAGLSAAANR